MLVDKINQFFPLDDEERRRLIALEQEPAKVFRPGEDLYSPGEPVPHGLLIQRGWATWQDILPDGNRQVFSFYLPADFAGLPWAVVEECRKMSISSSSIELLSLHVTALTEVQAVPVKFASLNDIFRRNPAINAAFLSSVSVGVANGLQRHLTNMGRRSARARLANLFVELSERQQQNGMAHGNVFEMPINQSVLADALGLTAVHVSRVMSQLTAAGVISFQKRSRSIVVQDRARLYQIAGIVDQLANSG